jgi:DNA polymerase-3 subunit beta
MELHIDKSELKRMIPAIRAVKAAAVTLNAWRDRLLVTAAVDGLVLRWTVPCGAARSGSVTVGAAAFARAVGAMPGPSVTIRRDRMESERTIITMPRAAEAADVDIGEWRTGFAALAASELRDVFRRVLFAASGRRLDLDGARLEAVGGRLGACATDGHRAAWASAGCSGGLTMPLGKMIPVAALRVVDRMIPARSGDTASVALADDGVVVSTSHATLRVRLVYAHTVDLRAVLPTQIAHRWTWRRADLVAAVRRLMPFTGPTRRLLIGRVPGAAVLRAVGELGMAIEHVACEADGPAVGVGFDARYLLDALGQSRGDRVVVEMDGPIQPALITDPDDDSARSVLMPKRID